MTAKVTKFIFCSFVS